ncbi:hypothetical protein V5O48_016467 [Marasmius crinis-equi]|uniref:Uncharacterized protein n=1 Tax=Marasmius crinis-equi TaxID=585013 RepID=A0ABR3ERN0_9AGAR
MAAPEITDAPLPFLNSDEVENATATLPPSTGAVVENGDGTPPENTPEQPQPPGDTDDVDMEDDDKAEEVEEDEDSPKFSDEAVAFLASRLPDYLALGSKKARRGYWQVVLPDFVANFPDQLELEKKAKVKKVEEKTDAELEAMSKKARRAFKARLKHSRYNPKQCLLFRIKNWFWWRLGRKSGDKRPFQPLFDDMKKGRNPPRRRQLAHIVMDEYAEEVKARSKETSFKDQLPCRAAAARDLLDSMEPPVRMALMKKREEEFEEAMRVYKGQQATVEEDKDNEDGGEEGEETGRSSYDQASTSKASPAPGWSKMTEEQRAEMLRCREGFIPIVQPFLDGLRDLTGYSMVLLAGVCTDPKEKKFTQATVHSKPGDMPDFAEHSGEKFKEFGKLFWRWLRDIKVATDALSETSADKSDAAGARTETESPDVVTQAHVQQPQPQLHQPAASPKEQQVDNSSKKGRRKGRKAKAQRGGGGQKKGAGRRKGGKGKKRADVWDSDRAEESSDDEVEGLEPAKETESTPPCPRPVRRSNRIQAHENPVNQPENLPAAPPDLSPLRHPKVYALALRYVYDDIKTISELENMLGELLGDQYSWEALQPLFQAVMTGEDGTESCAAAVKAVERENLLLDEVEPLYHPEVYCKGSLFFPSTGYSRDKIHRYGIRK